MTYIKLIKPIFILLIVLIFCLKACKEDEPEPTTMVGFVEEQLSVSENEGPIEVELKLDRPAPQDVTANYSVSGTAVRRKVGGLIGDYEVQGNVGELLIRKGSTSASLNISILDNDKVDDTRSIIITLEKFDNERFALGELNEVTITILDDGDVDAEPEEPEEEEPEPKPTVAFALGNHIVNESEGSLPVTIELDRAAPEDVVVEYSISGTATRRTSTNAATADYEITGTIGEVEIPQGETSATINIGILNDGIYEDDETIILNIEDVDSDRVDFGERIQATITIVSDDAGLVASFQAPTLVVNEADAGLHEIMVTLDQAPAADVVVTYQLTPWLVNGQGVSGVAIDSLSAYEADVPSDYYDYYVDGTAGQLTIPAGQTSAPIKLNILSDFNLEDPETIEITLTATPGITPGTANKMTITINQEDGRVVALDWGGETETDADMDLMVWFSVAETDTEWIPFIFSVTPGTNPPEIGFIPDNFISELGQGGFDKIDFGISAIYYSGTVDPLDFGTIIADVADGVIEPVDQREITEASYGLNNINEWDNENTGTDPIIIQTFSYTGGAYTAASAITVPDSRSRIGTVTIPKHLMNGKKAPMVKQFRRSF